MMDRLVVGTGAPLGHGRVGRPVSADAADRCGYARRVGTYDGRADLVAHSVLYVWTASVAALCALGMYSYNATVALSPHSWIPTLLAFVITFGIMRFFVGLLLDVYGRRLCSR